MGFFPQNIFFYSLTVNTEKYLQEPLYWQLGTFILDNLWNSYIMAKNKLSWFVSTSYFHLYWIFTKLQFTSLA